MPTVNTTIDTQDVTVFFLDSAYPGFKISSGNVLEGKTITDIEFTISSSDTNNGLVENITLYYNGSSLKSQNFTLSSGLQQTIKFTGLTTEVSEGDEFSISLPDGTLVLLGDSDNNNQQNNFTNISGTGLLAATITHELSGAVCLTESCKVLTKSGYKNVGDIKVGDKLLTDKNKESVVKRIYKETKKVTEETKPYMVPKNYYGENKPNRDIFISGNHMIKNARKNLWYRTKNVFEQKWESEEVTYYNFELENYMEDNMIVNGVIMESWDGKNPFEARTYTWKRIKYGYRRE